MSAIISANGFGAVMSVSLLCLTSMLSTSGSGVGFSVVGVAVVGDVGVGVSEDVVGGSA